METIVSSLTEYEAIIETLQYYVDGSKAGDSSLMRAGFHPDASLVGYAGETFLFGPAQILFDWIDGNGPSPDLEVEFASVEVLNTIAIVRLEAYNWSGKLVGKGVHMSDLFNLVKTPEGWKISQKLFHWHQ